MGTDQALGSLFGRSWKLDRDEDDGGGDGDVFGEWVDWIGELDPDSEDSEEVPVDEDMLDELVLGLI